jgi:hypothetical protein
MTSESISTILQKTLVVEQGDENPQPKRTEPSAASILLTERKNLKDKHTARQLEDFVPLSSLLEQRKAANPFFDQIIDSTVDTPTYWKGVCPVKPKNKQSTETIVTNAKKALILKGQAYTDRRSSKHASTASRKDRMHRLKNLY